MEGVPIRLLLSLVLAATIITLGFYELYMYSTFNANKAFIDDVNNLRQMIRTLQTTQDIGSFTRINLQIPDGSNFTVDNESDKFVFYVMNQTYEINASADMLWFNTWEGGKKYEIELYYGRPSKDYDTSKDELMPFL